MRVRHNARAVLLDADDHLVFLRRGWPGLTPSYCTTVGGGVEATDADVEAALRREVLEEIGGTLGPVTEVLTLTDATGPTAVVEHYYLGRLLDMDPRRRSGPELTDPDLGDFEPVRVALDPAAVDGLGLQPPELAGYVRDHLAEWANRRSDDGC
ncbi:NUDIX domain-containing protein [Streptomyces sp. NPDC008150]|uniref:NUDIX domain-containing protein n=1 Tax=Streptomyces sp. NPDC008150 TaxID=3364816 RepID=UPI0036E56913